MKATSVAPVGIAPEVLTRDNTDIEQGSYRIWSNLNAIHSRRVITLYVSLIKDRNKSCRLTNTYGLAYDRLD